MRKPIVGVLSTAFLLGMTASAQAVSVVEAPETTPVVTMGAVKVTIDGSLRTRGFIQQDTHDEENYDGGEGSGLPTSMDLDQTGYDGRVQLGTKVEAGDGVTGYIRLETGDTSSDVYGWGDTNGLWAAGGSKKTDGAGNDLSILEGWLQYQPCNVGVKVGHQLLSLGNKLFFDHSASGDDAIVVFGELINGAQVSAGVIKFEEGNKFDHGDDYDGYYGTYTQNLNDAAKIGANLALITNSDENSELYNLGVDAAFKLGMFDLSGDVEYQFGTLYEDNDSSYKEKAKGYAMQVMATANLNTSKVGALVAYGSGDDNYDDEDGDYFVNFLADTTYRVVIPGYRLAVPGESLNSGLSNLMILQLFASTKTTCPVTGKPLALEARVSKLSLNEDTYNNNEDDLGVEIAAFATFQITKNLSYMIEAAYLVAGDAWDAVRYDAYYDTYNVNSNPDPDDAYFLRHGIELKF